MVNSEFVTMMYQYSVLLIFFIMIFLAYIVSKSLIQTSVEQKEYESAMLRILGWNKKYIVIVTILKSTLFTIIPGATVGLLIAQRITLLLKDVIYENALIKLDLSFDTNAILVGIACALLLPLVSMI